jgi:hypothetical protein
MVPCTMVPFLSSMVTVSLAHFMRNLRGAFAAVSIRWKDIAMLAGWWCFLGIGRRRPGFTRRVWWLRCAVGEEYCLPDELHLGGLGGDR